MVNTNIAENGVSDCAGRIAGPIYQGEGCVAQAMGTEETGMADIHETLSADMESVI